MAKKRKQGFEEDWDSLDLDSLLYETTDEPAKPIKPKREGSLRPKTAKATAKATNSPDKTPAKASESSKADADNVSKKSTAKTAKPKSSTKAPAKSPAKKSATKSTKSVKASPKPQGIKDIIPGRLLPKKYTMSEEELAREKKRKAHKKAEEKKFREARRALNRRRKAARKALRVSGKAGIKKSNAPRQKRGFFASVWRLFDWFYTKTTDPNEKENRIHLTIFGRTLSYTGFMIIMALLIVVIFMVLNNRTAVVVKEEIVVTGLSDDFRGYNILVLSDLNGNNFGEDQGTLNRLLSGESYSLVLMLGDMVGPSGDTEPFYELIDLFVSQRKPVYFIAGDSDPPPLLDTPRSAEEGRTWRQMVLSDWVLGAIEHGATYLDCPMSITRGSTKLWLMPDTYLNLNITDALDEYKDAYSQQQDAYLVGIEQAVITLPGTFYRRSLLEKSRDILINSISSTDIILMVSHEVPSDAQISGAQEAREAGSEKNFFPAPDIILSGHYCGGEWRLPLIGAFYVDSSVLGSYGWFPDNSYLSGQRSIGGTVIYTSKGLGSNSATVLRGRLNNPPTVDLLTLTGELPASFFE